MKLRHWTAALLAVVLLAGSASAQTFGYRILDNLDADFKTTAGWTYYDGKGFGVQGFQQDLHYVPQGTGTEKATWTFNSLKPGKYLVSVTWFADPNRPKQAPFTIKGG